MANIKFSKEKALHLREQGLTFKEISEVMGCSKEWVNKTLVGVAKGSQRVAVDGTKIKAIEMVKDLLKKLEAM